MDSDGSIIPWDTYENIKIEKNGLAINPLTNKLYAIGTDTKSEMSCISLIYLQNNMKETEVVLNQWDLNLAGKWVQLPLLP